MALTSLAFMTRTGGYTTTLANKLDKIDCSQVLEAVLLGDKATLGHIKMGKPGTTIEHNWIEDETNAPYVWAKAGTTLKLTLATSLTSAASASKIARQYSILQREGTEDLVQISSTAGGTDIDYASYANTGATKASGATVFKWYVVAQPYTDIADASSDVSKSRSKRFNFMQIFERAIEITKTRENMDMEAVVNELQLQIERRTIEIKRELDLSVLRGRAYYSSGFKGRIERSTMSGIEHFILDPDLDATEEANNAISASAALTQALINTLAYTIFGNGGLGDDADPIIICGQKQYRVISAMEKELRRVEQGERTVGYYKKIFLTDLGVEMPIVLDRWCSNDKLIIVDRNRVALVPLQGDSWGLEKMAKTGRSQKWQLSGQYTLEVRCADKVHGMLYNLS